MSMKKKLHEINSLDLNQRSDVNIPLYEINDNVSDTTKPREILRSGSKSSLSAKFDFKRPSNVAKVMYAHTSCS